MLAAMRRASSRVSINDCHQCLDDRFHETTQLHLGLSIHGMRPFRTPHMIRTLETLD